MAEAAEALIADDQDDVLVALRLLLKEKNVRAACARSPAEVLAQLQRRRFDVLLLDLNYTRGATSGDEGMDLLTRVRQLDPDLPVIVITAWGTIPTAVTAIQEGARAFVEKPWDNRALLDTVTSQIALGRALRHATELRQEALRLKTGSLVPPLIGSSPAMQSVFRLLAKIAPSEATVLITGEHGTGKEVVARHLHAASPRAERPFVAVNAGGFADGVFDSELFGHVRGAFTDAKSDRKGAFVTAHTGTLFLDEIGNMPLAQQAKLLRVLQTREVVPVGASTPRPVDVRVIAATNVDLSEEVRAGRFREDLLYRINTLELRLPPLREREADIVELATYFLKRASERAGVDYQLHPDALQRLLQHSWPGNVRELEHTIERAVLLAESAEIRAADLCLPTHEPPETLRGTLTLHEGERLLIQQALERANGNISQAAGELGISRASLYRRLQRHGLLPPGR
ncbi:MAG: sigma-54 dependent transcriptional regulator [Pseudomonadota bacterium]